MAVFLCDYDDVDDGFWKFIISIYTLCVFMLGWKKMNRSE
jgi:hypothetical protein